MKKLPNTIEILDIIYEKAEDINVILFCKDLFPDLVKNPGFISRLRTLRHLKLISFEEAYENNSRTSTAKTCAIQLDGLKYLENTKYITKSLKKTDDALELTRKSNRITRGALFVSIIILLFMIFTYWMSTLK